MNRRGFVRTSVAAVVGLALPRVVKAKPNLGVDLASERSWTVLTVEHAEGFTEHMRVVATEEATVSVTRGWSAPKYVGLNIYSEADLA